MNSVNRRAFLSRTGKVLGGLFIFNFFPAIGRRILAKEMAPADFNESQKILVIYASHHGSTAEIATFLGQRLLLSGIENDIKSIDEAINFNTYSGIIMGAPIHRGEWMEDAIDFVHENRKSMENVPLACFFTCMAKAKLPQTKNSVKDVGSYQAAIMDLFPTIDPDNIGMFAGKLDYDKCGFFTKLVLKSILKKNNVTAGDYRDWHAIETWLQRVRPSFA